MDENLLPIIADDMLKCVHEYSVLPTDAHRFRVTYRQSYYIRIKNSRLYKNPYISRINPLARIYPTLIYIRML